MPGIRVEYSLEFETQRIASTARKRDWFEYNKYKYTLPEGIYSEMAANDVYEIAKNRFNEHDYNLTCQYLSLHWLNVKNMSCVEIDKSFANIPSFYDVTITEYGVGGSYLPPRQIIVNRLLRHDIELIRTTFHEMLHLMMHDWFQTYKTDHWTKERIVDNFSIKINSTYGRQQKIPVDTSIIDDAFRVAYPNVEKIVSLVS